MMAASLVVGKSEPGHGLSLALSFKDVHHPCWGGGQAESVSCLPHGLATRFNIRGRRASTSLMEEVNCHLLPSRGVAVRPPHGRRSRRA
jgi:hypothetical protein